MRKLLLIFCFLFAFSSGFSQDKNYDFFNVKGTVKDSQTGAPLPQATVVVDFSKQGSTTDANGNFSLSLFYGEHTIQIRYLGYKSYGKRIFVKNEMTLAVELENIANQLEEVVISGQSSQRTVETPSLGVNLLNMKAIQKLPAAGGEVDIIRSLQTLPGISSVGEGSNGVNIRGGNVDQNLIFIDDMPIFNPTHVFGLFSVFATDAIREMQIYKGSIPARFGGRTSSVLDIKMTEPNTEKFKISGGIGIISERLTVEVPLIKDKLSFLSSARLSYNSYLVNFYNNVLVGNFVETPIPKNEANFYDVANKIFFRPNAKDVFSLSNYLSKDNYAVDSLFGIQDVVANRTVFRYQHRNLAGHWSHYFNPGLSFNLSAVSSRYSTKTSIPDSTSGLDLTNSVLYSSLKAEVLYMPVPKHRLTMGLSGVRYDIRSGTLVPRPGSALSPVNLQKEQAWELAAYGSDEYEISSKLLVEVGLRYVQYLNVGGLKQSIYTENEPKSSTTIYDTLTFRSGQVEKAYGGFEPRLALRYKLGEKSSVKVGYNRMQQFIQLLSNNITPLPIARWKTANRYIPPQRSHFVTIGYFRDLKESIWEISVEAYYRINNRILDYVNGANLQITPIIESQVLQGKGKSYGLEMLLSKKKGIMTGWLSYTYARSLQQITGDFPELQQLNDGKWFSSNVDKPHSLNVLFNFQPSRIHSFSFTFAYSTGRPYTAPVGVDRQQDRLVPIYASRNNARISDYHRLDFSWTINNPSLEKKRWEGSWVFSIYNLYGRKNAYSYYFKPARGGLQPFKLSVFPSPIISLTYNFKFM